MKKEEIIGAIALILMILVYLVYWVFSQVKKKTQSVVSTQSVSSANATSTLTSDQVEKLAQSGVTIPVPTSNTDVFATMQAASSGQSPQAGNTVQGGLNPGATLFSYNTPIQVNAGDTLANSMQRNANALALLQQHGQNTLQTVTQTPKQPPPPPPPTPPPPTIISTGGGGGGGGGKLTGTPTEV